MLVRSLLTEAQGSFREVEYDCPMTVEDGIIVRSRMTGICRSDIDMMQGLFGPLPINMQGHEGLGEVVAVSANTTDVHVGDLVATRGEPAYADYYPVRPQEYVSVPEINPRYILEPVACAINIIKQEQDFIMNRIPKDPRILIIGSGFLAYVTYVYLTTLGEFDITVMGSSNSFLWSQHQVKLTTNSLGEYNLIIDLIGKENHFKLLKCIANNSIICEACARTQTKEESEYLLWRSATSLRPSPRSSFFYSSMIMARDLIKSGQLNVDPFWTRGYDRDTEVEKAFQDGLQRRPNYSRGYLIWR